MLKIFKGFDIAMIIILILILVFQFQRFYIAIHNIDLVYNFEKVSKMIDRNEIKRECNISKFFELYDTGDDFITRPLKYYYIVSFNTITSSFIITLICSIILGILIGRKIKTKEGMNGRWI